MTDHETNETNETPTEAEAREAVRAGMCPSHKVSCRGVSMRRGNYIVNDRMCDCGAAEKPDAVLDAYAEAVRASERARLAGLVRALREVMVPMSMRLGGELVDRADVLRLLTEDTAR